jgi:hypothetical protein
VRLECPPAEVRLEWAPAEVRLECPPRGPRFRQVENWCDARQRRARGRTRLPTVAPALQLPPTHPQVEDKAAQRRGGLNPAQAATRPRLNPRVSRRRLNPRVSRRRQVRVLCSRCCAGARTAAATRQRQHHCRGAEAGAMAPGVGGCVGGCVSCGRWVRWQRGESRSTSVLRPPSSARIRQHTSAYVSIRQHTSAYVSIRQHTSAYMSPASAIICTPQRQPQHTSAYVSIREHT